MKFRELARVVVMMATAITSAATAFAADKVKVATEASFPPFTKTEADGTYTGFEIDLGNEVCKRAGLTCEWVKQDFDGMIAGAARQQVRHGLLLHVDQAGAGEGRGLLDPLLLATIRASTPRRARASRIPDGDSRARRSASMPGRRRSSIVNAKFSRRRRAARLQECRPDPCRSGQWPHRRSPSTSSCRRRNSWPAEGQGFRVHRRRVDDPEVFGPGAGAMFRKGDPLQETRSTRRCAPSMPTARSTSSRQNGCRASTSAPTRLW